MAPARIARVRDTISQETAGVATSYQKMARDRVARGSDVPVKFPSNGSLTRSHKPERADERAYLDQSA